MKKTFSFVCESCGICRAVATFDEFGECTVKEIHNQPCEIVENEIDILTEDK